jgi:CheY-like chemotaxis protein
MLKVLIAEDDRTNRDLLRHYLELHGCEVVAAQDGQEGLDLASRETPDLIISDARMPVMDGFQFLRKIKSDENLKLIPFVFFSAFYIGEEFAMSIGADAFIPKPKVSELWEEIRSVLSRRTEKKEASESV